MKKAERILIADDEELNRIILEEELSEEYEVTKAVDGREALEIIKADSIGFQAVLTDLSMPEMNGFELLEALQEMHYSERVPVVVITAEEELDVEIRCLNLGAIDFVRKPFHFPVIKRRVRNVVDLFKYQHHLEDEVNAKTSELREKNSVLEIQSDQLRELAADLEKVNERIIEVLGNVVEFRNIESGTHIARVKRFTSVLAKNMLEIDPDCGLTPRDAIIIAQAAPMHDVGKISIPDSILLKPGKLSDAEFYLMKAHTTFGVDLLRSFEGVWENEYLDVCSDICHYHHERYDGKGYPEGLKGEEIPLSAQIVSVADVYDALVSDRVYRKAIDSKIAVEMIKNGECGQFSDRMIACFEHSLPEIEEISASLQRQSLR